MFKLAQKRRVKWPVTVNVPQDGGKTQKATFEAELEILTTEEADEVIAAGKDILDVQLVGWSSGAVRDEHDQVLEYSEAAKKQLLSMSYVRTALFGALTEINTGRAAARKN